MNAQHRRRLFSFGAAAAAAGLLFAATGALPARPAPASSQVLGASTLSAPFHPKMSAALARIAAGAAPEAEAAGSGLSRKTRTDAPDGMVRVVAELNYPVTTLSGQAAAASLKAKIEAFGGRTEARSRNRLQALVPAGALDTLASDPLLKYLRLPLHPTKLQVTSEGVARTGADRWVGIPAYRTTGAGGKICILDVGFAGYQALLGTELPSKVTARSFRADGDITGMNEVHGLACAEIVHDMAPDAQLWLVNFDTDVEESEAVDWIVQQGIQVISYSLGWFNAGAGDGTGPICADVEFAAAQGILWASAAGNEAISHWEANSNSVGFDGDGWLDFSASSRYLEFTVPAFEEVDASLNWKDWGTWNGFDYSGTDQDYDFYLYLKQDTTYKLVDSSTNVQKTGGEWPTEDIYGWYTDHYATWAVSIKRVSGTKPVPLELFIGGNDYPIQFAAADHSITVPADSDSAIAAGATDWQTDAYHYYSSQGPTWDGRIKPDLAAPSGVSTATYGHLNFYGTSASAPHVAGACGLYRGRTPFTASQVRTLLQNRAVDLGAAGKDNMFGFGRLNLK
jgi:hypothetical protein